jgi:hypothetical protein
MPEMMVYEDEDALSTRTGMRGREETHLLRLSINVNTECRVLLLETVEGAGEVGGLLTLGADGEGDDGFGNEHGSLRGLFGSVSKE